jgi:VanZ family protein
VPQNILFRVAFWLACFILTCLCLSPIDALPSHLFDWWDKAQHALVFFFLLLLGAKAYPLFLARVAIGLLFLGGAIEILQGMTGWRSAEFLDWLADGIGIIIGFLAIQILCHFKLCQR